MMRDATAPFPPKRSRKLYCAMEEAKKIVRIISYTSYCMQFRNITGTADPALQWVPGTWRYTSTMEEQYIKVLFKGKGEVADPNSYRGIALQQTHYKCLSKLMNNRIIAQTADTLRDDQFGFLPKRSTRTPISISCIEDIKTELRKKGASYMHVL